MRGMYEAKRKLRRDLFGLAERHWLEILKAGLRFFQCVERKRRIVTRCLMSIVELGIFFLQVTRVGQNNTAQINRRRSRIDRPAKSLFHQSRNPATMVEMSVSENQTFNLPR